MAEQEPILEHPGTQEMAVHVRDYSRFVTMFKWGAIVSALIAFILLVFVL